MDGYIIMHKIQMVYILRHSNAQHTACIRCPGFILLNLNLYFQLEDFLRHAPVLRPGGAQAQRVQRKERSVLRLRGHVESRRGSIHSAERHLPLR